MEYRQNLSQYRVRFLLLGLILFAFSLFLGKLWAQQDTIVHQGQWTKFDYAAKGTWKIVQDGTKLQVQLSADFSTKNAPDLRILFSPYESSTLTNKNATKDALDIGLLNGKVSWGKMKGPITLDLPSGVDLSRYKSIMIHCVAYTKLWSVSKL